MQTLVKRAPPLGFPAHAFKIEASQCISVRGNRGGCRRCVDHCPASALELTESGPRMVADCVSCGQCAKACPTGAISLRAFEAPALPHADAIRIDCWRVRLDDAEHATARVPCLGGLSVADLLDVVRRGWPRPVTLVDRGQCASCHAHGQAEFPARDTLDSTCSILQRMGWAVDQLPQVEADPLPAGCMFEWIPHRHDVQPLRRRAFFGEIASRIASGADESGDRSDRIPRRSIDHARASGLVPKRRRLLGVVDGLSRITGRSVPADLFPGASVSEACANHNVCAAACPTHALSPYTESSVCGIRFTPANCIECGACERTCPENAIKIVAGDAGPFRPGNERLTAFPIVVCAQCGDEFVLPPAAAGAEIGDENTCPACGKDVGLFRDGGLCARESGAEHDASLLTR